nr:hypothetical protein CFP56_65201 [Quercus suber]
MVAHLPVAIPNWCRQTVALSKSTSRFSSGIWHPLLRPSIDPSSVICELSIRTTLREATLATTTWPTTKVQGRECGLLRPLQNFQNRTKQRAEPSDPSNNSRLLVHSADCIASL